MSQTLYRKYRPQTFQEVSDQQHVKITIQNQLVQGTVGHAYLFSGPRGVGKTTIARILAKALNCTGRKEGESEPCNQCDSCVAMNSGMQMNIVEIDAASHTGVDHVREHIIEASRFTPGPNSYKVFIIDEVHMLSTSAFNALLKTLEEPPARVVFILATTEIHKIPQTVISRCQRFEFKRISAADMTERLQTLAKEEGVRVDDAVMKIIVQRSEGCLRDAESLFGQVLALGEKEITLENASLVLPKSYIAQVIALMDAFARQDLREAISVLEDLVDQGASMSEYVDELIEYVRTLIMLKLDKTAHDHYDTATVDAMMHILDSCSLQICTAWLDVLIGVKKRLWFEQIPQLPLEIALIQVLGTDKTQRHEQQSPKQSAADESTKNESKKEVPEEKNSPIHSTLEQVMEEKPVVEQEVATEPAEDLSTDSVEEAVHADHQVLTVEEVQSKWKRCCEAVAKRNIALPMVLQAAKVLAVNGNEIELGFTYKFHADTMQGQKNLQIVSEAAHDVFQRTLHFTVTHVEAQEDAHVHELAAAFGGAVMD